MIVSICEIWKPNYLLTNTYGKSLLLFILYIIPRVATLKSISGSTFSIKVLLNVTEVESFPKAAKDFIWYVMLWYACPWCSLPLVKWSWTQYQMRMCILIAQLWFSLPDSMWGAWLFQSWLLLAWPFNYNIGIQGLKQQFYETPSISNLKSESSTA